MSKQSLNSTVKIRPFTTADMAVLAGWFTSRREVVQWGGASLDYPLVSTVMRSWLAEADQVLPVRQCWTALR